MDVAGFDWDSGNRAKCEKHGVSTAEIEELFNRAVLIIPDATHSQGEERLRAIGKTATGRSIFLVFTIRARGSKRFIRPVSARYMHRKEINTMKKKIPTFKTDAEAARFVETADLTKYDLSGLKPMKFEFEKKNVQLNMRVPKGLLDAVKQRSAVRGIPFTRFVREAMESALSRPDKSK